MPRIVPRRPLELGKSVIEFRLTSVDADIKALLEAEGNISATIRKALRLYALYRSSGGTPIAGQTQPAARAMPDPTAPGEEALAGGGQLQSTAQELLGSLEADWE